MISRRATRAAGPRRVRRAIPCLLGFLAVPILVCAQASSGQGASLEWKQQSAPQTPGYGAIVAGPGTPQASPVYLCRAKSDAGTYPGKWVGGSCKIALAGQEVVSSDYEIAYGQGEWSPYQPGSVGLIATGSDLHGAPLYSCRVQYRGYQLGVILENKCDFPYEGRDIVQRPPFDALYEPGAAPPPAPAQPVATPTPPKNNARGDSLSSLAPSLGATNPGEPVTSCRKEVGKNAANQMVKRCLQVSPATHPPCNADNSCSLIRSEIRRGCRLLGTRAPDFCEQY